MNVSKVSSACLFLLMVVSNGFYASELLAQANNAPPRSLAVKNHLSDLTFDAVSPGFAAMRVVTPQGVELIALRFASAGFRWELEIQKSNVGETVASMGKRLDAQVVFNGGFFGLSNKNEKYPVGLLEKSGVRYSTPWTRSGGYLVFDDGKIEIQPTRGQPVPKGEAVLQSKPILIEPGARWAMNTNKAIPRKRTLVCKTIKDEIIVLTIVGGGMSLFEVGWLMRGEDVGGLFGCDSALAMDGGGSTQIWVKDRPDLSFSGETSVQNAIVIQPRSLQ